MVIFPRIEVHAVDHCTLSCVGCNHASPHLGNKSYSANDYIHWLDVIRNNKFDWGTLAVSGGEPFLLKESLNDFVLTLKQRYRCNMEIFTNAFWLTGLDSIEKFKVVFQNISSLQISLYEPYIQKLGWPKYHELAHEIRKRFKIKVFNSEPGGVKSFGQVYFYDTPVEVDKSLNCWVKDCTQLNSNGMLYRCTYGHFLKTQIPSDGFRNGQDMCFDLKDIGKRDLKAWREKWPLDSCRFCGCNPEVSPFTKWKSDTKIKGMNREEYLKYLKTLIPQDQMINLDGKKRINLL
jgi:hypothetical protein